MDVNRKPVRGSLDVVLAARRVRLGARAMDLAFPGWAEAVDLCKFRMGPHDQTDPARSIPMQVWQIHSRDGWRLKKKFLELQAKTKEEIDFLYL